MRRLLPAKVWLPRRVMVTFESPSICVTELRPLWLSGPRAISEHQHQIANKVKQFLGGSLQLLLLSGSQFSLPSQVHEANTNGGPKLLLVTLTLLTSPSISTDRFASCYELCFLSSLRTRQFFSWMSAIVTFALLDVWSCSASVKSIGWVLVAD